MFHGHEESLLIELKRGANYKVTGAYIDRFGSLQQQVVSSRLDDDFLWSTINQSVRRQL